jgi:DnaK suppressor protein
MIFKPCIFFFTNSPASCKRCSPNQHQEWKSDVQKTMMKPEKKEFFRLILSQKINELLDEAGKTVSEMTSGSKENYPDPNDRASLESERNFELRIRDRERKLILKMQEAIKRIDDGVFGICDLCGGLISEKRLMARPVTTLCIECKMKQEKMEKLKGE